MRIYTKTGDAGETGLFGGPRVSKDAERVEACGAVDELNAALGAARAQGADGELDRLLGAVQEQLFAVGANLATQPGAGHPPARSDRARAGGSTRSAVPPVDPAWTVALESAIDRFEGELAPLRHFILPGGTPAAASLHLARAVCRRAERSVVALHRREPIGAEVLAYLNRLSDFLFVAARVANQRAGVRETIWERKAGTDDREG
jgi:cob(I)alamin adenosyltransferase